MLKSLRIISSDMMMMASIVSHPQYIMLASWDMTIDMNSGSPVEFAENTLSSYNLDPTSLRTTICWVVNLFHLLGMNFLTRGKKKVRPPTKLTLFVPLYKCTKTMH